VRKDTKEMLERILSENGGIVTRKKLISEGISDYFIKQFEAEGVIERVKQGLFKLNKSTLENEELLVISAQIPKGVICLLSALSYYELTTYTPWQYFVAIPRHYSVPKTIENPPIKVIYFPPKQYNTGIEKVKVGEHSHFLIYDMEKTICDTIRYKDKYGADIMKEALKNYVRRRDKNLSKLVQYAETLQVQDIHKYLEVIL